MSPEQLQVAEFHLAFGFPVRMTPIIPSPTEQILRVNLIRKERLELHAGYEAGEVLAVADGLGDLLYVTYGAGLTCGIALPSPSSRSPLSPIRILSMQEYRPWCEDLARYEGDLERAFASRVLVDVEWSLRLLVRATSMMARTCGINLPAVFAEIHRSNMTKIGGAKRADGKLMKPPHYEPPNLRAVLGV